MMKKFRRFISAVALLLAVCLLIGSEPFQIFSYAVGEDLVDSKLYMSEVKMFYGKTSEDAKAACEKEGFIFCPTNLNEGAPGVWKEESSQQNNNDQFIPMSTRKKPIFIHMGYKTTDNPDEAITDLTLLDMKYTHFEDMDYEKFLDEHLEEFRDQAAHMMVLVGELDRKMKEGSPNALMAYDSLNLLYVNDKMEHNSKENRLGDYLINKGDIAFFEKLIQRSNSMILSKITSIICGGTSDYSADGNTETWVDRSKVSSAAVLYNTGISETRNLLDSTCQDTAKAFVKAITEFKNTYTTAKERFDKYGKTLGFSKLEGMTEENALYKLYAEGTKCRFPEYSQALATYALLDSIVYHQKGEKVVNDASLFYAKDSEKKADASQSTAADDGSSKTEASEPDEGAGWGAGDDEGAGWGAGDDEGAGWGADDDEGAGWGAGDEEESSEPEEKTEPQEQVVVEEVYQEDLTLAQYIMQLASDESIQDHLSIVYPIAESLTEPQRYALELGGLSAIVDGLFQAKDYPSQRDKAINEAKQKLKEQGREDGMLSIWTGTDRSIYNKKVVQTDATKEAEASGLDIQNSTDAAARDDQNTLSQALMIIDICTLGYGGIMMITNAILGQTLWVIGSNIITVAGANIAAGAIGSALAGYVLGGLFCALQVLNIVSIVVGLVMLIYSILQWCGAFDDVEPIDYTGIPDVVFDVRKNSKGTFRVRYNSVTSNASRESLARDTGNDQLFNSLFWWHKDKKGATFESMADKYAELTGYYGGFDRWMALFYSKDTDAGTPIEVTPGKEPFVTSKDYHAPEGYRPLTLIVGDSAADVNAVAIGAEKKKSPELYVFFPGVSSGKASGNRVDDDGTYITKVRFSHAEKREDAINDLKRASFEYYDVNLTPYSGYTYLGYQVGDASGALTDIRISNTSVSAIEFGDGKAKYAKMGEENFDTTPDGLALYATTSPYAGSPIVAVSIEYKRLPLGCGKEPVCLFSGGNAVDIGTKWSDNILDCGRDSNYDFFLDQGGIISYKLSTKSYPYEFMSQDDPDSGIYLYFQPKEEFKSEDKDGKPNQRYIAGFSYFLAGDNKETDNRFGTNYEFMKKFAKSNGFELVEKNGDAYRVMSDSAGEMTLATTWRDVGGYPVDTYRFDQYHTISGNNVIANGDGGLAYGFISGIAGRVQANLTRDHNEKMVFHTAMYFGVSYTYNPYRAITGIAGLITPYTESTAQIKYSGMTTPAGTFQASNVSIQGSPITSAGITAGYYNPSTMSFPLYTNYDARQKSDLDWITDKETEVLTHYLLTCGSRQGVTPLKEGDIKFVTEENPGTMEEYVPLCDLRTPGDYSHPLNLALETTNKGSKYLYLYLKKDAGGRVLDSEDKFDEETKKQTSKRKEVLLTNEYTKKKYVAGVFCGSGRTPEEAIANLYSNALRLWPTLAQEHKDISCRPMMTEFDEIIPVDLSSTHPWYEQHTNNTDVKSLKNGVWVRGNLMSYYRWDGHKMVEGKSIDEYEKSFNCAYVGVVRTSDKNGAAYGMLKYYTNSDKPSNTLSTGSTKCIRAGGPVKSPEGTYHIYYSLNTGTASYQAPITNLDVSDKIFINGYNTTFTVSEKDRKNNELPQYGQLRMRPDEHKYIHLGYDRAELPYYEQIYLGMGNNMKEAFADMVGTTNAYAAIDVNCNYNSSSKKWIAVGYRRTSDPTYAITDVFLYSGDNPQDKIRINGGYMAETEGDKIKEFKEYADNGGAGIPYKLVKHNLKSGSEVISLNEGNSSTGLYLYYSTASFYRERAAESLVTPITNMLFSYGDISPRYATTEDIATVFKDTYTGTKAFDASSYTDPIWECVLGVEGSPLNWDPTGKGASRFSLNKGIVPGFETNAWTASDNRVYMYVDRAYKYAETKYKIRPNGKLPDNGYYSATSVFGKIRQVT